MSKNNPINNLKVNSAENVNMLRFNMYPSVNQYTIRSQTL